jgi:dsDNA-binding SOS-regulon protein
MPIQLGVWERRDNGNREALGNAAFEMCRIYRKVKGITSCRYYWSGTERIVFLSEGETAALNNPAYPADQLAKVSQLSFTIADNAKATLSLRLAEPRDAVVSYRAAGR